MRRRWTERSMVEMVGPVSRYLHPDSSSTTQTRATFTNSSSQTQEDSAMNAITCKQIFCSRGSRTYWKRVGCLLISVSLIMLRPAKLTAQLVAGLANGHETSSSQTGGSQTNGPEIATATGTANSDVMSADAIVALLQQRPELLSIAKMRMAQQLGVDPKTITDDRIFQAIRTDDQLRTKITQGLQRMGYDISSGGAQAPPQAAAPGVTPTGNLSDATQNATEQRDVQKPVNGQQKLEENPAQVTLLQRTVPYSNLPSLQDLYTQLLPPDTTRLKRFGSDVFLLGTGNADSLPMDLPAGPDYVLGTGDALVINLWGTQSQTLSQSIDRQGQIVLPEAGTVGIAGMTIDQAQAAIQKVLRTQFKDMHVEISLGRVRTVRVYVVGDVQRPGGYDVSSLSTPLNALYAAGGPTSVGSLRTLLHYRGKHLTREIDLYDFLLRGVGQDDDRLLPGDTILVPPAGPQVTVSGTVRRPAIYELRGDPDLKQILELSGGALVSSSLQLNVERVEAHERRTMLSVLLPATPHISDAPSRAGIGQPEFETCSATRAGGAAEDPGSVDPLDGNPCDQRGQAEQQLARYRAQDGDSIVVLPILPYNQSSVYLDGHVFRPGKYPYHDGMTINDLLHSYQDVMPEPADHAELIRLEAPDYKPATTSLSLPDVLRGSSPILLKPFDVIRVFSRYEIDVPTVTLYGEVIRPGEDPLAEGMTASALVNLAGGLKRSAYREVADLASYVVQKGERALTEERTVDLGKAMDGVETADVMLKPGDVLSIRQITGWQDIGSAVTVSGEIGHAGTYGIRQGERLSSVLRRAGGFRDGAFPGGAVLERVQVREVGEKARMELIQRLQSSDLSSMATGSSGSLTPQEQLETLQTMRQEQQQALAALRNQPASGRLVVNISQDISKWQNTSEDVEMRNQDVLLIPKRADFVIVSGQVYTASALTYIPGKRAEWYLRQAGGVTNMGNKKDIFILRANGAVVGRSGMFTERVLSVRLKPGDSIVVPEKIVGGSPTWKSILNIAQMTASTAVLAAVVAP